MSATADRAIAPVGVAAPAAPARAEGLELLGEVPGSGYRQRVALVRRADGQMVQLGPLMFALLEELDGKRSYLELAEAMSSKLDRPCEEEHVAALAQKLAGQGLLAGFEDRAPSKANPLLALRWKVVVSDPELTRRLTEPFQALFRPVILVPVLAAFVAVCWYVLFERGFAPGAAQAFGNPELILVLFALGVAAAGFHELGHAAACRYGGGTPGAMGAGVYLVWPAFYTDVTDAYRLPRRDRLRTDLGGLYFNAIVAVATIVAWFAFRADALLLLIGLQLVSMVQQLSPVIRADGYHILSDLTGVPDLYAHIGPTLKQLLPGHRGESALTGRARIIVTAWVLLIVPMLLALMLGVVFLLPRLLASTWESGSRVFAEMSVQLAGWALADVMVSLLRLVGLALPMLGATYITWRLGSAAVRRAASWSRGHGDRRALCVVAALAVVGLLLWAWWPKGQYEPIRASDKGTVWQLAGVRSAEPAVAGTEHAAAAPKVPAGTHLAITLVPEGGATEVNPAVAVITDPKSGQPILIATDGTPGVEAAVDETAVEETPTGEATTSAAAFTFELPDAPREGDSQALAVNTTDEGVLYEIAYSLVTIEDGESVDNRNTAHAFANCNRCTTIAVSFQVVLVVGSSPMVSPVNFAESLNGNCLECFTSAIAHQIVVSVESEPSPELMAQLTEALEKLDAIEELGTDVTTDDLVAQVTTVQEEISRLLEESELLVEDEAVSSDETETEEGATTSDADEPTDAASTDPAAAPDDETTTTDDTSGTTEDGSTGPATDGTTDTTTTTTSGETTSM